MGAKHSLPSRVVHSIPACFPWHELVADVHSSGEANTAVFCLKTKSCWAPSVKAVLPLLLDDDNDGWSWPSGSVKGYVVQAPTRSFGVTVVLQDHNSVT